MSHIGISLSANTASYVKRIKDARTETDRNIIKMEQRIDKFAQDVNKNFTSVGGSIDSMIGGLRNLKGGGYVAAVAGVGFAAVTVGNQFRQMATETIEAQKQVKIASERARVSASEIRVLGAVASSVGLDLEKFGDINKDIFDKLGDYVTTGGGAFIDFFDVVKGKSTVTAQELQRLSGPEVLVRVVEEMEKVGASGSQMTWVLESIGNDASNLLPLLRNGAKEFKALQERMKEVSETPLLIKEAEQEVVVLIKAFSSMWDSFGVMMTNKMEGTFGWLTKIATYANNMFNEEALADMGDRMAGGIIGRNHKINTDADANTLRQEQKALQQWIEKAKGTGLETASKAKLADATARLDQIADMPWNKADRDYWKGQIALYQKEVEEQKAEFESYTNGLLKSYDNAIEARDGQAKAGGNTGKENLEKLEKVDAGIDASKAAEEMAAAKQQEIDILKDIAKQKADIAEYEKKVQLEKDDEVRKSMQQDLEFKKRSLTDSENLAKSWKKKQENITEALNKQEQKKADDAAKVSKKAADDEKKKQKEAEQEAQKERARVLNFYQQELSSAVTQTERVIATKALEMERIKQLKDTGRINDEQERELTYIAQEKEHEALFAMNEAHYTNEHEMGMARAEAKREWLQGALADEMITFDQFRELDKEAEREYQQAKINLQLDYLDVVSGAIDGMSELFEQGSKEQKMAFAAEKGVKIAEAMLLMESNAMKAQNSAPNPALGTALAIASRVRDAASIATMSAQAIGQFHSGSDEVDQTGSYILQSGERVVQRAANKDLTNFLEGNQGAAGGVTIDAPLVIEGDTTIDENRLMAMLVKQREQITKAVKMAQRENPSLR